MERFGTSPVRDRYWALVQEDIALRDILCATACPFETNDDIEEFEGIALEITDDGIKTSRGWKEFWSDQWAK